MSDTAASSSSDDRSEREVIARYNLITRIFPPPVRRSPTPDPVVPANTHQQAESTSSAADDNALAKSWFRLVDQKTRISALRNKLAKARRHARKARVDKDAVDNAFMSLLRPLRFTAPGPAVDALDPGLDLAQLQLLLDKMQEARNRCQASEVALETVEDELDTAQDQLDHLERLLINEARPGEGEIIREAETEHASVSVPESLLGLQEEPDEYYHPLYTRFLEAIGEHDMVEEGHSEHLHRKAEIEYDLYLSGLRQQYQQDPTRETEQPDADDLDFLRHFDEGEKKSLDRMQRLMSLADSLIERCFEEGVVPRYANMTNISLYHPDEFRVDPDPTTDSDQGLETTTAPYTTTTRFWMLLSNPSHLLEEEPVTAATALKKADAALAEDPDNLEKKQLRNSALKELFMEYPIRYSAPGDKGSFVNLWVLHRLRTSPGEVELMYSIFTDETGVDVGDFGRWQQDVLYCWPRDEAALAPPEQYRGGMSKVEAVSEGSMSDSSLASSSAESIALSDEAVHSEALSTSSHTRIGDPIDAQDEDTAGSDKIEPAPHVPLSPAPLALKEQDSAQKSGADLVVLAVAPEVVPTIEPEIAVIATPSGESPVLGSETKPPEDSEIQEPDVVHNTPSTPEMQSSESPSVPASPSDRPHGVKLEGPVATPAVQADEPVLLTEISLPSEVQPSPESRAVLTSLSEVPPVPSQEPQAPEAEAAHLASPAEATVSAEEVRTLEPEEVSASLS